MYLQKAEFCFPTVGTNIFLCCFISNKNVYSLKKKSESREVEKKIMEHLNYHQQSMEDKVIQSNKHHLRAHPGQRTGTSRGGGEKGG